MNNRNYSREYDRPYFQMLMFLFVLAIMTIVFMIAKEHESLPETGKDASGGVTSTQYAAPSCAKAMADPTDGQCEAYEARLIEQGFTRANDNSWSRNTFFPPEE